MENNIKNFDRSVEQKMNEHEVAPPFGMWNRISAELEAMPVAATVAPVVTSLIPKRALVGFIAAALITGTAILTGYLVNSSLNKDKVSPAIGNSVNPVNSAIQQTQPVKTDAVTPVQTAVAKPRVVHHAATTPVETTLQAAQQVQPAINQPVAAAVNSELLVNNATDVPTPIEPIAQSAEPQQYYFPPIDVNTPEKAKAEGDPTFIIKKSMVIQAAGSENKEENFSQPAGPKFARPHNKKKKFTYGTIIR